MISQSTTSSSKNSVPSKIESLSPINTPNYQTNIREEYLDTSVWLYIQKKCFNFWSEPEYFTFSDGKKTDGSNLLVCHQQTDSLFSSTSGFSNYRGLVNLCIVLLALSNGRVALENIIKYGVLVNPMYWIRLTLIQDGSYHWACASLLLGLNVFIFLSFWMERLLSMNRLSEKVGRVIHTVNLLVVLIMPAAVVLYLHPNPLFSAFVLAAYTIAFLKLISYVTVNRWCRAQRRNEKKPAHKRGKSLSSLQTDDISDGDEPTKKALVAYPGNLNLTDMYYFQLAPTLCYELNFPRSARIRKRFLIKRLLEMVILSQVQLGLIQQWMFPTINNSIKPFHNSNYPSIMERLLKLAIPNHIIWLIFFYWFFHSSLNVIAELLRFGDREFYKDWWNSESITGFWSSWNIPVHRWARRHLYHPLVQQGYDKMTSSVIVFLVSAFFHEYLVSVPLRMFRVWAFFGMLGQVPFAILTSKYLNGHGANMALWLSLIIGQPLATLMYVHDYYVINHLHADVLPTV